MREQTTTIEVGKNAGLDRVSDAKMKRPPLTRSITHYARVLAKKLKRRTVSDGPGSSKGESVSSTASAPAGIPGVTTSTVVVEEVKQIEDAEDGEADDDAARVIPEASVYPRDMQEIEIRVESEEEDERNMEKARALPLPPSPSPVIAKTFEDVGGPLFVDEKESEGDVKETLEDEREIVDSAIDVPAPRRLGEPILNFNVPYKDDFADSGHKRATLHPTSEPRLSVSPHPTITKDETTAPNSPEPSNAPFLPEFGYQEDKDEQQGQEQEQESVREQESELEDEGPSFDGTLDESKEEDALDVSTRKSEELKAISQTESQQAVQLSADSEKGADLSSVSVAVVAPSS